MIAGIFHQSSGLGNQLFRYITTRVLALDKGYEWGIIGAENFKGKDFMNLDMGWPVPALANEMSIVSRKRMNWNKFSEEKRVNENGVDIRGYDPEINFVKDNTIIDGEFQDERYWGHLLSEIRKWLKVEPIEMLDDLCVINFRGGEYKAFPELFLTKQYWNEAIKIMRNKYPGIHFEIHTDDAETAKQFFPNTKYLFLMPVISDIGLNWRAIRYAKHLILSNSSFAILPALLNENVKEIIAPRYWARRNTKIWALPQNYYKRFQYI